jgi:CheY-like chemotaxis protein
MVTLLIASGDTKLTAYYTDYFASRPITGAITSSQAETLAHLEASGAPDVLLVDMPLPDAVGGAIIRYMRATEGFQQAHIVMLLEEKVSILARPRLGIEHVLYKPISPAELGEYLSNLLETTRLK